MKSINHISTYVLLLMVTILTNSCNKIEIETETQRTVLVYMIASNSLGSSNFDDYDLTEMKKGIEQYNSTDCRLLIYHVPYSSNSSIELKEIYCENSIAVTKVLKTYDREVSSVSQERISNVISDMVELAPANDYGLVLWSHATGWIDSENATSTYNSINSITTSDSDNFKIPTRDFGDDNGDKILIPELVNAIPQGLFSFIYTDACYMGGIEIAYQFRNTTNYFIGSPTTLYAAGMPYNDNIPYFFESEPNLTAACEATYNYYQNQSGILKSNTIVLVDCTQLETLATACRKIASNPKDYTLSSIQKYTTSGDLSIFDYKYTIYDLKGYNLAIAQDEYLDEFNTAFDNAVLYCAATEKIFSTQLTIDPDKFFGLSSYILGTGSNTSEEYYKTLDWYNAIY